MNRAILSLRVALLALAIAPARASAQAAPTFPHGVASGDVRSRSAVLWTRLDRAGGVLLQVSTDPGFPEGARTQKSAFASPGKDFVVKRRVRALEPGTTYFYRFVAKEGGAISAVGEFRTAPVPSVPADVRFTFSGGSDGSGGPGDPAFNAFEVLDRAREEEGDFFLYLGDTIVTGPILPRDEMTLAEYWAKYEENREFDALKDLFRSTSTYAVWDDGEVEEGFDGRTVDPQQLERGRRAFKQFMPVVPQDLALGFFRTVRWGKDVEFFFLDVRSFRTGDVETACEGDHFPTLPANLRISLGLPASPPAGCLAALNDPARTMLGAAQKAVFKSRLLASDANFKFIVSAVPFSEVLVFPYDRWEGYRAEREEILAFLADSGLTNVFFLTTGLGWNLVTEVRQDVLAGSLPVAKEIAAGPIADLRFFEFLQQLAPAAAPDYLDFIEGIVKPEYSNPNADAYALLEVDASARTATVSLKDGAGAVLHVTNLP